MLVTGEYDLSPQKNVNFFYQQGKGLPNISGVHFAILGKICDVVLSKSGTSFTFMIEGRDSKILPVNFTKLQAAYFLGRTQL